MSKPLTPRQDEIMAILKAAPNGIAARAVAAQINLTQGRTDDAIRKLRELGLCAPVAAGKSAAWATADQAAALRDRLLAATKEARLARSRAWDAAKRQRQRHERGDECDDECDFARPSIKRTVPAASCSPIKRSAPASVFHRQIEAA